MAAWASSVLARTMCQGTQPPTQPGGGPIQGLCSNGGGSGGGGGGGTSSKKLIGISSQAGWNRAERSAQRPTSHLKRSPATVATDLLATREPAVVGVGGSSTDRAPSWRSRPAGPSPAARPRPAKASRRSSCLGASTSPTRMKPRRTRPAPRTAVTRMPVPGPVKASWPDEDEVRLLAAVRMGLVVLVVEGEEVVVTGRVVLVVVEVEVEVEVVGVVVDVVDVVDVESGVTLQQGASSGDE